MFFSVIIPVYQSEATIRRCLDSLKRQRYKDFEVVIIDDGASDNSGKICKLYASNDDRFHYFAKDNGGPSSARNLGLDLAKGDYVVFLDSDDCYRETYLESFYKLISSDNDYGHFWCGYTTISDNPSENGVGASLPTSELVGKYDRNDLMTLHGHLFLASLCNKAYKNTIIQENKLRMKEGLSLGEDLLFNLQYLDCCPNTNILIWNKPEYEYYCYSHDSLNHKYRPDLDEIYRIIRKEIYSYLKKWNAPEDQFTQYETMTFYMLEKVMSNYDNDACHMSHVEKRHAKESVIKSDEFQTALRKGKITIHPLLKQAYKTKNEVIVDIINKVAELKRKKK